MHNEYKIQEAAKNYANKAKNNYDVDYKGFVSGAEWALNNLSKIDTQKLSEDLIVMKDLHNRIFLSGGQFTEKEAELYESMVSKYEGLDLMNIFSQ